MQIHRGDVAQNTKVRKLIVGSMDIEKLCPNTIIRPTVKKINEMYIKSILIIWQPNWVPHRPPYSLIDRFGMDFKKDENKNF